MKRTLALLFCGALLFGAACSDKKGTVPAATVNGTAIPTQALVDELNAISANPEYLASLQKGAAQQGLQVTGESEGSFTRDYTAEVLANQIFYKLVHDEVAKRGLHADDACQTSSDKDVYARMGGADEAANKASFAKFPAAYQQTLKDRNVDVLLLEADLAGQPCVSDDAAKAYYDAHPDTFVSTCLSSISVTDEATANAVKARLDAGEDFATVAGETSIDPQAKTNGGELGCFTPNELPPDAVAPVTTTPVGGVSAPFQINGQYIIVKATKRTQQALEDVRQQAEELAASSVGSGLTDFLKQAVTDAAIEVEPRYGTFNKQTFSIQAPASASTGSTASTGDSTDVPTAPDATDTPAVSDASS